ncbi:MAG: hypothetical protein EU543_02015 [Promethearchaeota archaeon]|nr:MAG: hypothetical protein EU543_02015 [Candidatus Lokiarchaeota archaeon]
MIEENKNNGIQNKLDYVFSDKQLLKQALTTPQYGHEHGVRDYEILETLGDSVIKLIIILKKYKDGVRSPGKLTQLKQQLENDEMLKRIARKYFKLENYIYKSESQNIEGTKILADVFEALCGALFLDSGENLKTVENCIINKFYEDWDNIVKDSPILNKNKLLEFLQAKLRFTPIINTNFESIGPDNNPIWIAKNPRIYNQDNELLEKISSIIHNLESKKSRTKKQAEQNLYYKMLKVLRKKFNL